MSESPYAPPRAVVADAPEPPRVRPRAVVIAVALLWTELVPSVFLTFLAWDEISVDDPAYRIALQIYVVIWLGISVLVNTKIWQGRNWARIVALILTLFAMIDLLGIVQQFAESPWETALSTAALALDVAAVVIVFGPGRDWFRRRS